MGPGPKAAAWAAAAVLALPIIILSEGKENVAYLDVVRVPTSCYGHTGPEVQVGAKYTDDQCMDALEADLSHAANGIKTCIKADVPPQSLASFISFSYNVGTKNFCQSTLVKKLNAGDLAGACAELSKWTKAKGQVWPGLVKRRAAERAYCERGLK